MPPQSPAYTHHHIKVSFLNTGILERHKPYHLNSGCRIFMGQRDSTMEKAFICLNTDNLWLIPGTHIWFLTTVRSYLCMQSSEHCWLWLKKKKIRKSPLARVPYHKTEALGCSGSIAIKIRNYFALTIPLKRPTECAQTVVQCPK